MPQCHIDCPFIFTSQTNWDSAMNWTEWSARGVWMTAFPPTQSHQTKQANPFTFNQNQMLSGIFKMLLRLTSSHKCHPSCQNEPGNVHPPHQWRLLHRWGMGSYGQQPPASYLSQNCISHRSKQTVETLQETQFRQWNFGLVVMEKWALLKVLLLFMKSTMVKYAESLKLKGWKLSPADGLQPDHWQAFSGILVL